MSEIFISYARSTAAQAEQICEALRALGYDVWRDDELPAHRDYSEVIEERLRAARAVVVVWSAEAVKSQWVRAEADVAREAGTLVQLSLDGAILPLPFNRVQCADMAGWSGDLEAHGWRKVVASVSDLMAERGLPSRVGQSHASAATPVEPLLAVLAFDNLSGDAEMAYFSDGVSEEILQTVARGAELKVIGRGSSFQFRGADKAAAHVAATLKATHVLDGSVRRSGSKVRIAANLIECARETTLWSDRFDRELSDVFALQDEIAAAVAAALKVAFAPATPAETVDPTAYNLYLKALEIRNRGLLAPATVLSVIELLEEATVRAPRFARAWAFLATMQADRLRFETSDQPYAVTRVQIVEAAETALALDANLGSAHQALGQLEPFGHFAQREALHRKALSVATNDPTVLTNASLFLAEVGRIQEALELSKQAYDLDPMYPWAVTWYAALLEFAEHKEACLALWANLTARWPDNELIMWGAVVSAANFREWIWFDELVAAAQERGFNSPTMRRAITAAMADRVPDSAARARTLERARDRLERTGVLPLMTFTALYKLGHPDETFELIDQTTFAYMLDPEQPSPNGAEGPSGIFNPVYSGAMMRDIRFVGLCAKLGLADYWAQTDRWPDCAEALAADYDFKAEARRLVAARSPAA
ncbi:MAG: TIR domain-containing protein [Caulobacterales bacterium]